MIGHHYFAMQDMSLDQNLLLVLEQSRADKQLNFFI